jgi:hypothetical protein
MKQNLIITIIIINATKPFKAHLNKELSLQTKKQTNLGKQNEMPKLA